jgi:hypothetical protein
MKCLDDHRQESEKFKLVKEYEVGSNIKYTRFKNDGNFT